MTEPEWIRLDTERLNSPHQEDISGVTVKVLLSPHDVPTATRGRRDPSTGRFVIEFKYIDDEPWHPRPQGDGLVLRIGRHSNRLYGIEIPATALQGDQVRLQLLVPEIVDKAIADLTRQDARFRASEGNYNVAREVILETREQLLSAL